jgi:hypothetical protein
VNAVGVTGTLPGLRTIDVVEPNAQFGGNTSLIVVAKALAPSLGSCWS